MALIEKFHVVAAERPVATGQIIKEGAVVSLNTSGEVVIQGASNPTAYGIAGDTKSTTASAMPGIAAGWQSRASDYYDETKASGMMTVYHSGGEFATDQFSGNVASSNPMAALFARNGVLDTKDQNGLANVASGSIVVAYLTQVDGAYPSGVPGTDINGDQALSGGNVTTFGGNANSYIEFKLVI